MTATEGFPPAPDLDPIPTGIPTEPSVEFEPTTGDQTGGVAFYGLRTWVLEKRLGRAEERAEHGIDEVEGRAGLAYAIATGNAVVPDPEHHAVTGNSRRARTRQAIRVNDKMRAHLRMDTRKDGFGNDDRNGLPNYLETVDGKPYKTPVAVEVDAKFTPYQRRVFGRPDVEDGTPVQSRIYTTRMATKPSTLGTPEYLDELETGHHSRGERRAGREAAGHHAGDAKELEKLDGHIEAAIQGNTLRDKVTGWFTERNLTKAEELHAKLQELHRKNAAKQARN